MDVEQGGGGLGHFFMVESHSQLGVSDLSAGFDGNAAIT